MPNENKCYVLLVVLITGVSGYIGTHCLRACLDHGYRVRGTVRSLTNESKVAPLKEICPETIGDGRLELVEADLLKEEGWDRAVAGCDFVLHVASPFPSFKNEQKPEEVIKPAVDGTINVLRACAKCPSLKRVVLTSSVVAITVGHRDKTISESDWSDLESPHMTVYEKSKTIAEKAAWDFVNQLRDGDNRFELVCLNPGLVTGPLLHREQGTSVEMPVPLIPAVRTPIVDVRDVALAHVRAIESQEAAGHRIILVTRDYCSSQIGKDLAQEFNPQGYSVPTRKAPKFLIGIARLWDRQARFIYPNIDVSREIDNSKMKNILGLTNPIAPKESLVEMAYSLIERGMAPKKRGYLGPKQKQTY